MPKQTSTTDDGTPRGPRVLEVDDLDLPTALHVATNFSGGRFDYIVTANVDHAIRYFGDAKFRDLYAGASLVLLDSRFLARLLRYTRRLQLKTCPGSDLTTRLFEEVIQRDDRVVLVGGSAEQAAMLRTKYGTDNLVHIDPPMGFIKDPPAVEACLRQIEAAAPFRFCFLGIGSPQQEVIASMLRERGVAQGLGLCIGASIDYMTGKEERAPRWLQEHGFEWFWRLTQNPRRLAYRYLVRGPKIFRLLPSLEIRTRAVQQKPARQNVLDEHEEATEI